MSGSAVLGGAVGFSRASAAAQDDSAPERLGYSIVQGGATAAVAAGVGAFAWKSRDVLSSAAWGTAKGIGESTSRSLGRAFQAKGFTGILSHPLTMAGFGAVAGGLIGSKLSDDPIKGGYQHAVFVNLGLGADFDERPRRARNRRSPTPPGDLDKRHAEMALVHSLKNCRGHRPGNLVFSHRIIEYSDIAFADRAFVHPTSGKIRDAVASRAKMGFLSQTMSSRQRVANIASGCRE